MLLKTEDIRGCETLFEKAVATHMAGDLEAAETMYKEILDREPVNAAVIHNLGLISFQGGDLSKAARLFETALDYRHDYPEAYCNLGVVLKKKGRRWFPFTQLKRSEIAINWFKKEIKGLG